MTEQPTVGEFMTEHVHVISMESTLPAARKLMAEHQIRHLPVMDGRHVVGLLSERDLSKLEGFPMQCRRCRMWSSPTRRSSTC